MFNEYKLIKESKYYISILLNFALLILLGIILSVLERDILFIIIIILYFSAFIVFIYNAWLLSDIISKFQIFNDEMILGLHSQTIIHNKYQVGIIRLIKSFNFLTKDEEKKIIRDNLISLRMFEMVGNYKYVLIAMGSILEFLLIRYCMFFKIAPADYKIPDGSLIEARKKRLVNYIQSAINNNLFNQKKKWRLVQSHLRDFRNYVHITKECVEEKIDENWYKSMKPIFESILEKFET